MALPNPHDPRVAQQFLMTALWKLARAAGGTLIVEVKDAMPIVPLNLSFVEQGGVQAAIIAAGEVPSIVPANAGAVSDLTERLKNGSAIPASALKR